MTEESDGIPGQEPLSAELREKPKPRYKNDGHPGNRTKKEHRYECDPNSGCWLWALGLSRAGYGTVNIKVGETRKSGSAHRVAYEDANGPIPPGQFVLHRCDTRACVNPAHLFLGTSTDNMRDMQAKGRWRAGHRTKTLSSAEREEIRRIGILGSPEFGTYALSRRYLVSPWTIGSILKARESENGR